MEAVENQRQVYHRSHRPWKSLQDFHTPAAQRLLINKTKREQAEVSPINCRPVCLTSGVHCTPSPGFTASCLSPGFSVSGGMGYVLSVTGFSVTGFSSSFPARWARTLDHSQSAAYPT